MRIIADSCCDYTPELKKETGLTTVPLTITIDGTDYVDDGSVDIVPYLRHIKASPNPARSACPSPDAYAQAILEKPEDSVIITLSSKLSGSYNAAVLGAQEAMEAAPGCRVHVFDSESATAGEAYLLLMVRDLIKAGKPYEEIVALVEEKIRTMHTLFVLESLDSLAKNGRVSKAVARIANVLNIRLLLSDDGEGDIKVLLKGRGHGHALKGMVDTCRKHTELLAKSSVRLVITYCNCLERAENVRQMIREHCPAIGEIVMLPTTALSSLYASDGGVVIAY